MKPTEEMRKAAEALVTTLDKRMAQTPEAYRFTKAFLAAISDDLALLLSSREKEAYDNGYADGKSSPVNDQKLLLTP